MAPGVTLPLLLHGISHHSPFHLPTHTHSHTHTHTHTHTPTHSHTLFLSPCDSSGIATYIENPDEAYQSLVPLLDFALSHIPEPMWPQASLYVLCTAGMRFLGERDQATILGHLSHSITANYPFHVPQDAIQVISGQMEGVCVRMCVCVHVCVCACVCVTDSATLHQQVCTAG